MTNPQFSERYRNKAKNLQNCFAQLALDEDDLLHKYSDDFFVDGVAKIQIFREILKGEPTSDTIEYLDKRCTEGFEHHRGDRSGAEYGADLILGWIQEDGLLMTFEHRGLSVELIGEDRNREFLERGKISSNSDLLVSWQAQPRKVELAYDATGYWRKTDNYDMRDEKFSKLQNEKAIVFGLVIASLEGFVIDFSKPTNYEILKIPFHFIYKKPVFQVKHIRGMLAPIAECIEQLKVLLQTPAH